MGNLPKLTAQKFLHVSCLATVLVFLALSFLPAFSQAAIESECAQVKLEITQELTLERQAFDAHMRISNGLDHITLQDVQVVVNFADEQGNTVLASSDPDDPDALFYIRVDSMANIDDVASGGTVAPSSAADIHWLIIPSPGSSNGLESGTLYYIGASLTYTVGGEENATEVTPDYIYVKPMPQLVLDYFLPVDVYGDDAFTPEVEAPVPFSLGVRIKNNGAGVARQLKIDAAQPKIVENEQGLLTGFKIESSEVNGLPAEKSLLVDIGDIAPGTAAVGRWMMTCSLSGRFMAFSAANTYTYYKNGLKKSFSGPDGIVYQYTYDANNQLTSVQIPGVGAITVTKYTWNRPQQINLPGGSKKEFSYDPLMRLTNLTSKDPAQNVVLNYQYAYDKMDNIVSKTTWQGVTAYAYDDLYRLTHVNTPNDPDESFTYDAVGNRLTSADTTGTWNYNQNNELEGYDNIAYSYDANGNMAQKTVAGVTTKFFYNIENRLERVEDGAGNVIATYYYDPFGRRLWKEVGGVKIYFHYSDEGLVTELDAAGNVTKSYGYKPSSTWATDPLFMKVGTEYFFYHNNHLGTPQKMTTVNGAVSWRAKYSSLGELDVEIETVANNLRFIMDPKI